MKLNGNAIKPGNVIEHNGRLWSAVKVEHVKPGKGGAFAQIELRDIRDGTKLNERFRSSETVERVILEEIECTFLFDDGDNLVFMQPRPTSRWRSAAIWSVTARPSCRMA